MDTFYSTARFRITPGRMRIWHGSKTPSPSPSPPPRPDELKVLDTAGRIDAYTILANYYRVVFALVRGDASRPRLPLELVIYIIRLAEFSLPHPSRDLSSLLKWKSCWPDGSSPEIEFMSVRLVPLLKSAPLSQDDLQNISRVEIVMNFLQHTEHYNADFWNCFHIGVSERTKRSSDKPISGLREAPVWPCFPLVAIGRYNESPAPFEPMRRSVVEYKHEIWHHLVPGDRIEVLVMSQVGNVDYEAVMRVFKKWEPSPETLEFL